MGKQHAVKSGGRLIALLEVGPNNARAWVARAIVCLLLGLLPWLAVPALAGERAPVTAGTPAVVQTAACTQLAQSIPTDAAGMVVDFAAIPEAPTRITAATPVAAAKDVPAFCHVEGYIAPSIGIDLRLPMSGWNGKFAMMGCGGMCGGTQDIGCDNVLARGYACIMSDMGHRGTQVNAEWALNNLQGEVDFGFRATHVTAVAGKYITEIFYGHSPAISYFLGCSTGGRQGFLSAQRFPYDFNGIVAGAPPLNEVTDGMGILWSVQHLMGTGKAPLLTAADLRLVHHAVLAQCDAMDGLKDGVIGSPDRCAFDPRKLVCKAGATGGCLSAAQADAVREVYAGPHDSKGRPWYFGIEPGSELNWIDTLQRDDGGIPRYQGFMQSMMRFLDFMPDKPVGWTVSQFDWDQDPKRALMMEALMNAQNPDLRRFESVGGKLLSFHGWNDHTVQPGATIDYYDAVERAMGGRARTQGFFRLFMEPGMPHCQGGDGAYARDWLSAIENWVEHGTAPDTILSVRPRNPQDGQYPRAFQPGPAAFSDPIYSRLLVPYPLRAVYRGKGDPNDARSFVGR